jgi:Arc/MetJ-type ribon-helix-helix transcriptional regulator
MAQFVTRIENSLADRVDSLVAAGILSNRSEAVRIGLERLADELERRQIGAQIVAGYRRAPQTEDELDWLDRATERLIADEPW